jgi:hypothetical protein
VTKQKKTKKKAAKPAANPKTNDNATVAVAEPEATGESQAEPAQADEAGAGNAPAPKKSKGKKQAGGRTLSELAQHYLDNLADLGKSQGTCFSYRGELALAIEWLGAETKLADLGASQVEGFFECPSVTRTRTGRLKSPLSIAKTQRVLRQALVFAVEKGWIKVAPLPQVTKAA